jgi:hypothetical protein
MNTRSRRYTRASCIAGMGLVSGAPSQYGDPMAQDGDIDEVLRVIRDVNMTSPVQIRVTGENQGQDGDRTILLAFEGEPSAGLGIVVASSPPTADRIVQVANQIQDFVVETLPEHGHPAVWPECGEHPGSHPLEPATDASQPVWRCPRSGQIHGAIGGLRGRIGGLS